MFAVAILMLFAQLNTVTAACTTGTEGGTFTNADCESAPGAVEGFDNVNKIIAFSAGNPNDGGDGSIDADGGLVSFTNYAGR